MRLRDATLMLAIMALLACGHLRNEIAVDNGESFRPAKSQPDPKRAVEINIGLAVEYMGANDYEAALDKLQKAIHIDGSSATAYSVLGLLYERINRPVQAGESYAKAARLAPDKGDFQNNYAQWLCHSGRPVEADPYFRKALDDPFYKTPAAALSNAGTCALKAGKPELAETYYRRLLTLDANNVDALQQLAAMLYQRGDYLRARAFMERRVNQGTANAEMLDLAARIEDKLGDRDAANSYRRRLSSEFPQYNSGQP